MRTKGAVRDIHKELLVSEIVDLLALASYEEIVWIYRFLLRVTV